jgi:hypothetical protein
MTREVRHEHPSLLSNLIRNRAREAGVQSAHGLLETDFRRILRFRTHLFLLSQLDSYEGHDLPPIFSPGIMRLSPVWTAPIFCHKRD